jgi:aspartyl protease family protein
LLALNIPEAETLAGSLHLINRAVFMTLRPELAVIPVWAILIILLFASPSSAQTNIQVRGLFKGSAVLDIDGKQRLLKVGKTSPEGVTLLAADPRQAVIEVDGEQHTLGLSKLISSSYQQTEKREIPVPINSANQYRTTAQINGRRVPVLIDTGANTIALSSVVAKQIGINYQAGKPSARVTTASASMPAYQVRLDSVDVGGIRANNIDAVIIEGDYPQITLLGMTYLKHVTMREEGGIMYLKSKY